MSTRGFARRSGSVRRLVPTLGLLLLAVGPAARGEEPSPYVLLGTPVSLFAPIPNPGLSTYRVPLALSGNAVLRINQLLRERLLDSPRLEEYREPTGKISIRIQNEDYPRDILNELQIQLLPLRLFFGRPVEELRAEIRELANTTTATLTEDEVWGRPCYKIRLEPKGDAIQVQGRVLPDGGKRVSRTVASTHWIDKETRALVRAESEVEYQDEGPDGTPRGGIGHRQMWFEAKYETIASRTVPVRIVQVVDGVDSFEERISYREELGHLVFDRREVDYFDRDRLGLRTTLIADYGEYEFGPPPEEN